MLLPAFRSNQRYTRQLKLTIQGTVPMALRKGLKSSQWTGGAEFASPAEFLTIVQPINERAFINLSELWRYREVAFFLTWRNFKVRYRQTYLGILWALLQPVLAMSVFSIFFGKLIGVSSNGAPYPLFVLCGLVPWNFFSRAAGAMSSSLIHNQELVKRVYLPRVFIPASALMSSAIDMVPGFFVILIALITYGMFPPLQILLLPAFLATLLVATLGIGLTLAAWNVRFRDIGYIVPVAIQILLFATPVIYPSNLVPEHWRVFYSLNPLAGVIEGTRWCVLATPIEWNLVAISAASSAALLAAGLVLFSRSERAFADYL